MHKFKLETNYKFLNFIVNYFKEKVKNRAKRHLTKFWLAL